MISIKFDEAQITKWAEDADAALREFAVEVFQDANELVVNYTPVDTGNLRGGWYASIGEGVEAGKGGPDPSGGAAIARLNATLAGLELGDIYTVQNGVEYAPFVENGTSKMAPAAMVGRTLDQMQEIADAAARRVASRNGS